MGEGEEVKEGYGEREGEKMADEMIRGQFWAKEKQAEISYE